MAKSAQAAVVPHAAPEVVAALALVEDKSPAALAYELQKVGMLTITGLDPGAFDPDVSQERWTGVGVLLGILYSGSRFGLGDWINWGDRVFGEEAAQAVEATPAERYDAARRVTGLEQRTLENYASVCGRVAFDRRRPGVSFSIHERVASLPPEEQTFWLDKVVELGWSREELVRQMKGPEAVPEPGEPPPSRESRQEQADRVLALVFHQAQPLGDGRRAIDPETYAQVAAYLGEE